MPSQHKIGRILHELRCHLPFTLIGVTAALGLLALVYGFVFKQAGPESVETYETVFHFSHFGHIFLSATATTALFYRHSKKVFQAILVGFSSTLLFCAISDFLIPYIGGVIFQAPMHVHVCLLERPGLVLAWNALGILIALLSEKRWGRISYASHSAHVFFSSFASLFYLVSFGFALTTVNVILMFLITVVAVIIPCCSSDIIMPLSFVGGIHGHEHEDEHTCGH